MTNRESVPQRSNWLAARALLVKARRASAPVPSESYSEWTKAAPIGRKSRLLVVIGLAMSASSVAAQTLPEDECARLEDPEAEIICLRAALAATRQAQPAEVRPQPVETAPAISQSPSARPASEGTLPATVSPSERAAPERPAPVSTPELGREQVARPAGAPRPASDPEVLVDRISDFRADRNGALIMQLENGQIWRQVENIDLPLRLNEGEQTQVEITRSGFGGYRMHFPAMNRTISVSRIR